MEQAEKTLTLTIPNAVERVSETRASVRNFLMDIEASEDDVFEILVAVEEATTNALRHNAKMPGDGLIEVRCAYMPAVFFVQVSDDGTGFDYDPEISKEIPDPFAPGGRGLFLMNHLMDRVYVESSERGTSITMTRHLHGVDNAPGDSEHERIFEGSDRTRRRPGSASHDGHIDSVS